MNERERMREKIAKVLCDLDGNIWDDLEPDYTRMFGQGKPKFFYYTRADDILALPEIAALEEMVKAGFRRVI